MRHAGGDLAPSDLVFPAGTVLGPAHLGVLASLGVHDVEVVRRARVRRSKLYYLRSLAGKAARLREKRVNVVPATAPGRRAGRRGAGGAVFSS